MCAEVSERVCQRVGKCAFWLVTIKGLAIEQSDLSITTHHHPSPSITIHHHPSPSITTHHHPSPPITIHHHPSPSITSHHHPSPSITIHHHPSERKQQRTSIP
jgi:hypothetical protein